MLFESILTTCALTAWINFFFFRKITFHGRSHLKKGIHKDAFLFFYLNGLISLVVMSRIYKMNICSWMMAIHLIRRIFESSLYAYTPGSNMSIMQCAMGLIYYPLIAWKSFRGEKVYLNMFLVGTAIQIASHYLLFRKRKFTYYSHYVSDAIIQYSILQSAPNTLWISSVALITLLNRGFK
ncbi:hypothetical protein NEFER03_1027 [Nematocida sp. LUAm3]|nr:hypothetical protein NEFER03_1027 [Nematocida sp. LUAm3]KAI5175369.1 hypothetical protein NEFER02_1298 [Nematocida sp. LUAm2]KAI5177674.1 hypothetical protein NEFER01_0898 [Nematocida sp. LUAm1]